jgi:hypothetical protein
MRVFGRSLAVLVAAILVVGLVGGQQPGGFGFGKGGGFGGAQDAYTLLRLEQVKKELSVTDEQMAKVPAAVLKALGTVLDEKQMTRLRQIELQQRGTQALLDTHVQAELKITPEQGGNIKTILTDSNKEIAEFIKENGFQGSQEKIAEIRKETTEKVQSVLTADQRREYKQMLGAEFKLDMKGFGGKGGKGGKKKKDI